VEVDERAGDHTKHVQRWKAGEQLAVLGLELIVGGERDLRMHQGLWRWRIWQSWAQRD
jgi:hypothetical protein